MQKPYILFCIQNAFCDADQVEKKIKWILSSHLSLLDLPLHCFLPVVQQQEQQQQQQQQHKNYQHALFFF